MNIGAEWDTPFLRGLTLSGRAIYTSGQYYDNANLQQLPDWIRFDVGARYTFDLNGKPVTIRANVINVGVPGNIRPVILAPGQTHTVSEVLQRAGFNSAGYELRISGDRANLETVVQPGQTILLLKAVRGA